MPVPRLRLGSPAWLRWPRRTARLRFTALYAGLFLLSGAALVAITYVLFERATEYHQPQLPQVPHTPAIHISAPAGPHRLRWRRLCRSWPETCISSHRPRISWRQSDAEGSADVPASARE